MNNKQSRPQIAVFTATTAAGKTTIMNEILKRYPKVTKRIVTYTTRPPRLGEIHGVHYYFCSRESFEARIRDGRFIEWATVYGNYYGTYTISIFDALEQEDVTTFISLDVQGHLILRAYDFIPKESILSIFIDVPPKQLRARLVARGEEPAVIERRLKKATMERAQRKNFDIVINNANGRLHQAIQETIGVLGLDD